MTKRKDQPSATAIEYRGAEIEPVEGGFAFGGETFDTIEKARTAVAVSQEPPGVVSDSHASEVNTPDYVAPDADETGAELVGENEQPDPNAPPPAE